MADGLMKVVEDHPAIVGLAVVGIVVALMLRGGGTAQAQPTSFAGYSAPNIDPQAAAISEAAIAAGAQNIGTIASLVASQGQTEAAVTISGQQTAAQLEAARINAQVADLQTQAGLKAALAAIRADVQKAQFQKDVARASSNTGILSGIIHGITQIASIFAL